MKQIRTITFALLFLAANGILLNAQNGNGNGPAQTQHGNAVISSIHAEPLTNNLAELSVRVSGNLASQVNNLLVVMESPAIPGGTFSLVLGTRFIDPDGSTVLKSTFPINVAGLSGPTTLEVSVSGTVGMKGIYGDRVFYHWGSTVSTSNP